MTTYTPKSSQNRVNTPIQAISLILVMLLLLLHYLFFCSFVIIMLDCSSIFLMFFWIINSIFLMCKSIFKFVTFILPYIPWIKVFNALQFGVECKLIHGNCKSYNCYGWGSTTSLWYKTAQSLGKKRASKGLIKMNKEVHKHLVTVFFLYLLSGQAQEALLMRWWSHVKL